MAPRTGPRAPRTAAPAIALLALLALVACAGPSASTGEALARADLRAGLAARGASLLGQGQVPFRVGKERFPPDCTGFVEAVYAAEGIPLRRLMERAAPRATSGVAAAWAAVGRYGERWRGGAWPEPGDLVFFDDTWDRNGDGKADDPFTHVGLVEWVDARGTVTFLHRGGRGVARAVMTLDRRGPVRGRDGQPLNDFLRARGAPSNGDLGLTGELFAGFGRIEPARIERARLAAGR